MKKLLLIIGAVMLSISTFAQSSRNADGSIKYRGNVAIMVTSHYFTEENGVFEKKVDDDLATQLKTAFYAMAQQKFGNSCFGVVNRDNEAYANVRAAIEEQKLEDYMNGFSVTAKGEGADCLFLADITTYTKDKYCQYFISCRMINMTTNVGFHYSIKSEPFNMADTDKMTKEIRRMTKEYEAFLYQHILDVYPEQYAISKADGKNLYLIAYQPNGRILTNDVFTAFKYSQESLRIGNNSANVTVLNKLAEATDVSMESGLVVVKSSKALQPSNDIVLMRNTPEPKVSAGPMLFTYFPLTYTPNTYEGFIKNRVNNAVYDAMTRHDGICIIEQEHLPDLKKERELQKTEEFIDGHVVEQMKAYGAQNMIHLDNFKINGSQVSFTMSNISIAQNRIVKSVDIVSSIDNIENEMYKHICNRAAYRCNLNIKGKNITIISGWSLATGTPIIIQVNKPIQNPVTNEVSYSMVQVCKCTVTNYMGNKFDVVVDEVLSKEDFAALAEYDKANLTSIMIDGSVIKSNTSTSSDLEKKAEKEEKKEKRKAFFNALQNGISVN